jgi:DNA polymerase-1
MPKDQPMVTVLPRLVAALEKAIADAQHEFLLYEMEMPLAAVLADMELCGFRIDVDGIVRYGEVLKETAEALQSRIYSYAGEEFNISSPKQLGEVLFEKMCLPKSRKTKTGYSTDAEVLQKLIPYHPIIEDILDYRQMTKLKSTYADGLAKAADSDGRVHSIFHQTGTVTGRLSSSDPNLQNIPIRDEDGKEVRKAFVPDDGCMFLSADYSQIELRIMAHLSGDKNMIEDFRSGYDIHAATAAKIYKKPIEEVTKDERRKAKTANFGIIYGISVFGLAERMNVDRREAKELIDNYFETYKGVYDYIEKCKQEAKANGYVERIFHR